MKSLVTLIIGLFLSSSFLGQVVELKLDREVLSKDDTLQFSIKSKPDILLEIVVFTEDKLVLHQNSRLNDEVPFSIPMKDYPAGNYQILVVSDDIHIQRGFVLKD